METYGNVFRDREESGPGLFLPYMCICTSQRGASVPEHYLKMFFMELTARVGKIHQ